MTALTSQPSEARAAALLASPIGRPGEHTPTKYVRKEWERRERIPLGEIINSNPVEHLVSTERLDPMYDGLWMGGASAYWVSAKTLHQRHARWLAIDEKWKRFTHAEGVEILTSRRNLLAVMRMVAVLMTWRTCSAQQLAALIGTHRVLGNVQPLRRLDDELLWAAFAAGLIDLGCFPSPAGYDAEMSGLLVRLNRVSPTWEKVIEPMLTWPEWISVTAGLEWDTSGQYDRHNLLTTELGLRVAEYLAGPKMPVVNVMGERFTGHDLLTTGLPSTGLNPADRRGDLMVLRRDGVRIIFETTATASTAEKKARNWAELMRVAPMDVSGFIVVFICAADPENTSQSPERTVAQTAAAITRVVREIPGAVGNRTAERFGLIEWSEWFPERHAASPWFETLKVAQPTGPMGPEDNPWEHADLVDPEQVKFAAAPHFDAKALIRNCAYLASGPWWLRPAKPAKSPQPALGLVDRYFNAGVPVPTPERPARAKGTPRRLTATLPARLRVGNTAFTARQREGWPGRSRRSAG